MERRFFSFSISIILVSTKNSSKDGVKVYPQIIFSLAALEREIQIWT